MIICTHTQYQMANCRVSFPIGRFQTQTVRYISTSFQIQTPKGHNVSIESCLNPQSPNRTTIQMKPFKANPVRQTLKTLVKQLQSIKQCLDLGLTVRSGFTGSATSTQNRKSLSSSRAILQHISLVKQFLSQHPYPGQAPTRYNQTCFSYLQISFSLLVNLKADTNAISFQSCRTSNPTQTHNIGWSDIFCYLNIHNKILKLSLKRCSITAQLAKNICEKFPELIELDLSINTVGDEGAIEIATHLKRLRVLRLVDNGVGEQAGVLIGRNLKCLRELGLNNNFVGNQTAYAIATNLLHLRQLYLGSNQVSDDGCIQLAASLSKLSRLWIRSNRLSKMGELQVKCLAGAKTDLIL